MPAAQNSCNARADSYTHGASHAEGTAEMGTECLATTQIELAGLVRLQTVGIGVGTGHGLAAARHRRWAEGTGW